LSLSQHALRVEGPRVGPGTKESSGKQTFIALGKPVHVEIQLDHPLNSVDEAQALLNRVFFLEDESADRAKPEYRRSDDSTATEPVYQINIDGIKAPRATYTPEPDFSEQARRAKFQGTVVLRIVVDKSGNVTR